MHKLAEKRELLNLTQEELAEKSGISVRTIQRIESGQIPKGFTLKSLTKALDIDESYFNEDQYENDDENEMKWNKIANLSVLPFICFPPLNILIPFLIIFWKKRYNTISKKILSIQILWGLISIALFVFILIINDWLMVKSNIKLLIPIFWVAVNAIVIIRNAYVLSKGKPNRIFPDINIL
jgi:transcriptional regulator with XRE-family HTH domain